MLNDVWVVMESGYVIEKSQPIVMLFSRNYNNQYETVTHKFAFKPYFYAPYDELYKLNFDDPHAKLIIEHSIDPTIDAKGREIFKCITRLPSDVPKCRDLFTWTDESDVLFDKRFLIDHRIKYAYQIIDGIPQPYEVHHPMKPRVLYLDIEVVSPQGDFPYPSNAKYQIISIQTLDSYNEKIAVFTSSIPKVDDEQIACQDEYELYKIFTTYVKQINPDILAIWNGDQFDLPYLFNRAKILGINIGGIQRYDQCFTKYVQRTDAKGKVHASWRNKIPGRASLDMMEAFKKYNIGSAQRESNGLKSVISDKELLKDKAFSYQDIGYMLDKIINVDKRYDDFIAYCKNDVVALKTIDDKLGLYEFFETIRLVAGNKINDGLYNSLIIDGFLMFEGIKPMPRKTYGEKSAEEEFEGALVIEPVIGIHDWVANVDLNALYPHIVVGFNVSPDIDGIVAKSTKKLMDLRERYREEKRQGLIGASSRDAAAKALANSVYGVIGSKSFRLFDRTKAEFVTSTGKQLNIYIQKLCKDLNKKIVYGDSVAKNSIVKIFCNGGFKNLHISELFTSIDDIDITSGKEYCIPKSKIYIKSLNDSKQLVFRQIKYIMRHKCEKQMYRVSCTNPSTFIEVTEDHSLISYDLKKVKPINAKHIVVYDKFKQGSQQIVKRKCKIESIHYDDYVYDIEVEETHRFFANDILLANTDSVFLSEIRDAADFLKLESYLNEKLKEWSIDHHSTVTFKLKAEKIFKRLLFKPKRSNKDKAGKKKYAGQLVWNEGKDVSYLKYMGLEIKRSDNSNITKDCLNKFLTYLLIDGDQERAVTYVRNSYRDVRRGMVSILDISIPKEIRQIKYDGKNSWVLGKINAHDKYNYNIQEGEKPRLVYLLNDEVICIDEEFDVELIRAQIDWDKMADKTIKSKLESYFWAIGEDWNSAVNGQQKLTGFFE